MSSSIEKAMTQLVATQESFSQKAVTLFLPTSESSKIEEDSEDSIEWQPNTIQKADKKLQIDPKKKKTLVLDTESLAKEGYLTVATMDTNLAEDYRHLKRPLLQIAGESGKNRIESANVIAITSAVKGEGKTFTSFNLAMSIAMGRDSTVLLIDGDLVGRSLTKLMKLTEAPGLTNILLESHTALRDIIVSTDIPKFKLIPAGQVVRASPELLASRKMRDLTIELSNYYHDRIVVFDTPPLLETSLSIELAAHAGQNLVVVEEGKTSPSMLQEALSLLDRDKAIGMILNKSSCRRKKGWR